MDEQTVAKLFTITILVGLPALAVALAVPTLRARLAPATIWLAAGIAVSATLGSLYFSEIADFVPCKLCWFQRIAMYPLAVILPIAAVRRDRSAMVYVLPIAVTGLFISAYHFREQLFPEDSNFCELDNPCTAKWIDVFGFFTIPSLAGLSFLGIIVLGVFTVRHDRA